MEGENNNILVLRKYATDIKDSIYSDFEGIIKEWELEHLFIIQQNYIECKGTGSYVRFRGLDDSEKVKGISGFRKIILEEISQFDYSDFKQIKKRLRGLDNQQIIGIFNPISEEHWIKKKIFDLETLFEQTEYDHKINGYWINEKGNTVILKTNYLDNIFIVGKWAIDKDGKLILVGGRVDQHVIEDFENDKVSDYDYYWIYALGNWGEIVEGDSPFATQFEIKKHVSEAPFYDIKKQLIISVDFNLIPFCVTFRHLYNDSSGPHYHIFDEYEIKQGSIPAMVDLIKLKYKYSLPNAILTGDAMGKRGDISQRDNATLYLQLLRGLGMNEKQLKVSSNPTHENSRSDCNYVWYHFPDYKVHPKCVGLIRDLKNVQVNAVGAIVKGNRKDTNQRADYIDTERYAVHNVLYKWIDQHQRHKK